MELITRLMNRVLAGFFLTFAAIGLANATPNILSVFPSYDATGNAVSLTVNGTGFGGGTVVARISGVPATAVSVNATGTQLVIGVPNYAPGDYKLRVSVLPADDDARASVFDFVLGAQGPQGIQGIQGPQGNPGVAGANGATGPAGPVGPPGGPGPMGPAGAVGPKGDTGAMGAAGSQGAQGPPGVKGDTGAQGPQGASGAGVLSDANGNTSAGNGALPIPNGGYFNSAFGDAALASNTTGSGNAASGSGALISNTTGYQNTASGWVALSSNTTGYQNTASGYTALGSNTTGYYNTASGWSALSSNTIGISNTASGANALYSNSTGGLNTASGSYALDNNTTGSDNTANGVDALAANTTGYGNTASGLLALSVNTTGNYNTAVGFEADAGGPSFVNATAIGAHAIANANNKVRLGDTNITVIEGQVPYTYTSDRTQKENFQPVAGEDVLSKIRGLNVTSWNYIGQDRSQFRHYGPMAQDFFVAFGHDGLGAIGTPITINSGDLDGILTVAAQALEKRTSDQESRIVALTVENADFRSQIAKLQIQIVEVDALKAQLTDLQRLTAQLAAVNGIDPAKAAQASQTISDPKRELAAAR